MKKPNPLILYLSTVFFGILINTSLIVFACKELNFDRKSEICVYLYAIPGYIIKTFIFTLPYLLLFNQSIFANHFKRNLIMWIPFLLFIFWFSTIIIFQIESLFTDISFGYFSSLPHFYVQLFTTLILCLITTIRVNRKCRKEKI